MEKMNIRNVISDRLFIKAIEGFPQKLVEIKDADLLIRDGITLVCKQYQQLFDLNDTNSMASIDVMKEVLYESSQISFVNNNPLLKDTLNKYFLQNKEFTKLSGTGVVRFLDSLIKNGAREDSTLVSDAISEYIFLQDHEFGEPKEIEATLNLMLDARSDGFAADVVALNAPGLIISEMAKNGFTESPDISIVLDNGSAKVVLKNVAEKLTDLQVEMIYALREVSADVENLSVMAR